MDYNLTLKTFLSLEDFRDLMENSRKLVVSEELKNQIAKNSNYLQSRVNANHDIYGTTTGYGASCVHHFSSELAKQLPDNLIKYHGCGMGETLSENVCKGTLLIRLVCNAKGFSGISSSLLETMVTFFNEGIYPAIPSLGSVGASGDLTPLSYLAASLKGERECYFNGKKIETAKVLKEKNIKPYKFLPKEALALMNGTSVMSSIAALSYLEVEKMADFLCESTGLLVELLHGRSSPYFDLVHQLKPHPGQKKAAKNIFEMIHEPKLRMDRKNGKTRLQDSYSIRCAPHVIGVLYDTLNFAKSWIETEINSVNDNPIISDQDEMIFNAGNFYGGHIATACDVLKTSLANAINLIDKQMAILLDSRFNDTFSSNLVSIEELKDEAPIHHGFKAMQINLSALSAEIAHMSQPMSIYTRPTEAQNQDVVSMGTIAARQLSKMVDLSKYALAINGMMLRQALYLKKDLVLNSKAQKFADKLCEMFSPVIKDRELDREIESVSKNLFHA